MRMTSDLSAAATISPDTRARVSDYFALLKPRVMALVVFTALTGMIMAPGTMPLALMITALVLIAMGAGASAALNMWYDADIDADMSRTMHRPIPSGRISADSARHFGLWLSAGAVFCFAMFINYFGAALLAFTIFFYAVVYTIWLKRRTPHNIVIGGLAGALPPLIGWVSSGQPITIEPLIYVAIIFFWTPPHFWALALLKIDEYGKLGIPMLPVVAGVRTTKLQILFYSILMIAIAFAPLYIGTSGIFYGIGVGIASGIFLGLTLFLIFGRSLRRAAGFLFGWSILWLFLVFLLLPLDTLMRGGV